MRTIEMRGRLLAAVTAGFAMGCHTASDPVAATVEKVDADTSAPRPEVGPIREREASKPRSSCPTEAPAAPYCLAPFTQPATMVPPDMQAKLPFDKQGCLARENLNDACGGVREVIAGPRFEHGQCCFTVCQGMAMPCGRPLLDIDARPRLAVTTARHDWSLSITVRPSPIAARLREEWLEDAAAEHASIAAFNRFTMEMLAVGAPCELVERSQRAGQDEIQHARACYAIASSYGGPAGPGPLSLSGIALRDDLADIAAATFLEGCIGETYAAMCADEARVTCMDPEICRVLGRLAEDEARHAELAWQFVAWAIVTPGVREAVERAFAFAPSPSPGRPDVDGLRGAGRLDSAARARVWRRTRDDIVAPCLRALGAS